MVVVVSVTVRGGNHCGKFGKKEGALTSRSKKEAALTPRSKATESALKNKMKDIDGFSTISDHSSSSRKSRRSGRFTPKDPQLYQYYDSQLGTSPVQPGLSKLKESEDGKEAVRDKDSGYTTISDIHSSQVTGSSLSAQEFGISRHMSDSSQGKPFGRGYPRAALSPVKSESDSPLPKSQPHTPKDWRRFFELIPNAQERKQMELIRREMEAGKLKHHTLPPISYFAEDLPMLPGEAGTRLLQTVRVGEKMPAPGDGRHRIESVPGKLAVHTQNEDAGLSNFGILQMQWTTGVPSVRDRLHPPQRIAQHRNQAMIQEESLLNSANSYNRLRHGLSEEELNLPYLDTASPSMTNRQSANQYEWEYPLPPPPAKESRTQVPMIRKDHENYCKYYHLLKKKLHLYTSQQKERSQHLPELFVKRLREQGQGQDEKSAAKPRKQTSLTKIDSSLLFPPIKLGQLVKIC